MNIPSPGPYERARPSPVGSPYTSARSPSGHLAPYPPARRYSRDYIPMTGSQTPLHDEPREIDHDTLQQAADSVLSSSSSTPILTHHDSHTSNSDTLTHPSHPPGPLHRTIGFAPEVVPGTSGVQSSPRAAHLHFDANNPQPPRSGTPLSMSSSRTFVSQNTHNSQKSTGRASYRVHCGTSARFQTPASNADAPVFDSLAPPTLGIAGPGGSAIPLAIIALPNVGDSNRPGEPVHDGNKFRPLSVSDLRRYDHRNIRPPSGHDYKIEAMSYQFPETPGAQGGWAACQHPEGALYFVHSESKTFTEVDVRDQDIRDDIEYFRDYLYSELETETTNRNLSECLKVDEVQLVLEPMVDELGSVACYYYFVNPRNRSIFWLNEWEGESIFKYSKGILSPPHKGLGIQAEYWCATHSVIRDALLIQSDSRSHWAIYPNFCNITQELKDEVVGMILHARCDHLTSRNRSSCPLNTEELKEHLSLVDRIDPGKTEKLKHSAIIIGRIMHIFYENYFLNYHGEDCARLNSDQAIHGWRYQPSLRMKTCAPLLFMLPVDNVRLLHSIFIDEIASKEKWNMFVTKLNSQLQETTVLATVLLNANVSFLQVAETSGTGASLQEFLSYMSLVTSMASIILGLVFMGHSRTEARGTAFKAAKFLSKLRHKRHGLETLAIVYSLPPAFLMWGMCLFSAAFATQWCYPDHTTLRACAGASMFMVALLVAWCIWIARDRRAFWWFQPDPVQGIQAEPQESEDEGVMEI